MGSASSYTSGDKTSLVRGLGASIHDCMKPTQAQVSEAWSANDERGVGLLGRRELLAMMAKLIDLQVAAARDDASRIKMDMARQQARMEREARAQRTEVLNAAQATPPQPVSRESLDRAVALAMGSGAGPVMAGIMAGYVDIPVTSLTKMKADTELLEARVDLMIRSVGNAEGLVSQDAFFTHYMEFFDNAPRVLGDGSQPTPGGKDCIVQ